MVLYIYNPIIPLILLAKDELARLVLDLEDYDIPLTSDREDYPSLAIGIGDSSDIYTQSPTLPGTEVGLKLVLAPEGWSNHRVATNGVIGRISDDALTPFEKCRVVRQLSREGIKKHQVH